MKKKDEAFIWFCTFKALVQNLIGKKIKILRTDNGTKYERIEFKNFCREVGIKRETTMFVGYSKTSKAYRVYVLSQGKWRYATMSPLTKMLP